MVLYHPSKKKRLYELGRKPANTLIADKSALRVLRTKGGGSKTVTLRAFEANVYNPKTKKHAKVGIKNETGNPANVNYVRRNILTKGAIVDTSLGKARITSSMVSMVALKRC